MVTEDQIKDTGNVKVDEGDPRWQERVWERIDAGEAARRDPSLSWGWALALVLAVLLGVLCLLGGGCTSAGETAAVQAVAGPVVTVTPRAPDQMAVSWSVDPVASQYLVYQSADSGPFMLAASVFDSSGAPPATSWIADGLTAGVSYCFSIVSAYPDGSISDFGASACGSTGVSSGTTHVQIAGSLFQLIGDVSPTEQLWVAAVNTLLIGQKVTAGSMAVQCAGPGGGYFIPCARSREVGGWQCGAAVACGTAATAAIPFPAAFTVGAQNHLDLGVVASAPTFIVTTAVLTVR